MRGPYSDGYYHNGRKINNTEPSRVYLHEFQCPQLQLNAANYGLTPPPAPVVNRYTMRNGGKQRPPKMNRGRPKY